MRATGRGGESGRTLASSWSQLTSSCVECATAPVGALLNLRMVRGGRGERAAKPSPPGLHVPVLRLLARSALPSRYYATLGGAVSVQPGYDPKKADRYHAFRQGWKDAAAGRLPAEPFIRHATRPDMVTAYQLGFEKGETAVSRALLAAQRKYGYAPSVLRAAAPPGGQGEPR
jgi:hypothetical protein